MESRTAPATHPDVAVNPLPKTSLHRAIEQGLLGWFAAAPERLAVFLSVAGCPQDRLGSWLAKLAEVGDGAQPDNEPPPPDQQSPGGADRPDGPRRPGRRVLLAVAAMVVVSAVFLVVVASYATYYGALGLDLADLPVGAGQLAASTTLGVLLIAVFVALAAGFFLAGAALVPASAQTRVVVPASGLSVVVAWGGYVAAAALLPEDYGGVLAIMVLLAWWGFQHRLIMTDRSVPVLLGLAAGIPVVVAAWRLALLVGGETRSRPWFAATLLAVLAVAVALFAWWTRRAQGGDRPDQPGHTTPGALLRQLRSDLAVSIGSLMRTNMPAWQARRVMVGLPVGAVLLTVAVAGEAVVVIGSAGTAGQVVRDHGYLPESHDPPLIWPPPVRPAVLIPTGGDPAGVCEPSSPRAASVVDQDRDGSWVLLRPITSGGGGPEVVRLAAADYTVRVVLDPAARDGTPWQRPACSP